MLNEKPFASCTSANCPERKSVCCNALCKAAAEFEKVLGVPDFYCSKCGKEFMSRECNADEEINKPEMKNPFEEQLDEETEAKNNMTFWYPILQKIKMRVPKTTIVYSGDVELGYLTDGEKPEGFKKFLKRMNDALKDFTLPVFLRTGMLSDKHSWNRTCFLKDKKDLVRHITNLVETSYIANIAGFPFSYDFWVIREMLETEPIFNSFPGSMPITKEFRFFINNGKVQCYHPYWPEEAFRNTLTEEQKKKLKEIQTLTKDEEKELNMMAAYIARFFKNYWSVDFLKGIDGKYWVIDMAVGERSYHFDNCKYAK